MQRKGIMEYFLLILASTYCVTRQQYLSFDFSHIIILHGITFIYIHIYLTHSVSDVVSETFFLVFRKEENFSFSLISKHTQSLSHFRYNGDDVKSSIKYL